MTNVSDKRCTENQNTNVMINNFTTPLPPEKRAVYEMWKKYCTAAQATDDSMAHAHRMLDTQGYQYTLTIRNTHCF